MKLFKLILGALLVVGGVSVIKGSEKIETKASEDVTVVLHVYSPIGYDDDFGRLGVHFWGDFTGDDKTPEVDHPWNEHSINIFTYEIENWDSDNDFNFCFIRFNRDNDTEVWTYGKDRFIGKTDLEYAIDGKAHIYLEYTPNNGIYVCEVNSTPTNLSSLNVLYRIYFDNVEGAEGPVEDLFVVWNYEFILPELSKPEYILSSFDSSYDLPIEVGQSVNIIRTTKFTAKWNVQQLHTSLKIVYSGTGEEIDIEDVGLRVRVDFKEVEYGNVDETGIAIIPINELEIGQTLTSVLMAEEDAGQAVVSSADAEFNHDTTAGHLRYALVLTSIPDDKYSTLLRAVSWYTIDGVPHYSEEIVVSVVDVAHEILELEESLTPEEIYILNQLA
ncbi:MAG: hypothetical protein LBM99_04010 [Bacillales bacterium]|jgi:hypothetical protein|nr:hypothetical protein [Bacillales bacterium]